jgi:hypothetical protein
MNKPVVQLDLIPPDGPPPIAVALRNASVSAETVEKILAQAGPCDSFDWSTDDSVVVKPRPGVAIYENKAGEVVIRSQNTDDPDDGDHFAFVQPEGLPAVIKALKECLP